MKKIFLLSVLFVACIAAIPAQNVKSISKVTDKTIEAWFAQKDWKEGFKAQPAPSVDKRLLYEHYKKHPDRWKKVFQYLATNDLLKLPVGNSVLDANINVKVQEYNTREFGEQRLEGHRQYIDFQYVITGSEFMGSGKLSEAKEVAPFDPKRDWGGYSLPILPYYIANSSYFFIFFPEQVHLTNLQVGDKAPVRKIVFKIKVD